MNFSPSAGHEMAERHYAIVLSPLSYNRQARMALVCPITSRSRGWAWEIELPPDLLPPKSGVGNARSFIISDAVRQVDYREREMQFIIAAPAPVVEEVLNTLMTILE
jgi:mRNA interferase MazF